MKVNPRSSMEAARRLVAHTHKRVQGRTDRVEQAARHAREQKDRAAVRCERCADPATCVWDGYALCDDHQREQARR